MSLNFRKSKKIGGVRFTVSKSGISTSVGGKHFRITQNANGRVTATTRAMGMYSTETLSSKKKSQPQKSVDPRQQKINKYILWFLLSIIPFLFILSLFIK